jgi:hypothetical protein
MMVEFDYATIASVAVLVICFWDIAVVTDFVVVLFLLFDKFKGFIGVNLLLGFF